MRSKTYRGRVFADGDLQVQRSRQRHRIGGSGTAGGCAERGGDPGGAGRPALRSDPAGGARPPAARIEPRTITERQGRADRTSGGSAAKPRAFRYVPGYAPSARAMFDEPDRPSRSAQRQSGSQPARSRGNAARRPEHRLEVIRHRSSRPGATRAIGHTIAIDRPGRNFFDINFYLMAGPFRPCNLITADFCRRRHSRYLDRILRIPA